MSDKSEGEERARYQRKLEMMRRAERLYRCTSRRYVRRRKVKLSLLLDPKVKAIIGHIIERDKPPSLAVLFEEMLAT